MKTKILIGLIILIGLGAGTTVAIADNTSCAVKIDGSVVCWGIGDIPTSVPGLK